MHQVYFAFPTFQDQKIIYLFKMGGRGVNSGKEPYLSRPRNRNRRLSKSGNLPVQKVERSQHNESQFNVCSAPLWNIFLFFVREDIKTCSKLQSWGRHSTVLPYLAALGSRKMVDVAEGISTAQLLREVDSLIMSIEPI